MARSRRTRFAASFVAVVAAGGCSHDGKGGVELHGRRAERVWSINGAPGACTAMEWNSCPHEADIHCNPPPPIAIECPPGAPTDGTAKIVSWDGKTCVVDGPDAPIACPAFATAPPPPPPSPTTNPPPPPPPPITIDAGVAAVALRRWSVTRAADGTCSGFEDPCSGFQRRPGEPIPPCNPPPVHAMKCPPSLQSGGSIVEQRPGVCVVDPGATPVDCP